MKSPLEFKKVYLHREPVDMRKAINGLSEIVSLGGLENLFEPTLFVFTSRSRELLKILYFDKSGFALWQKRLEKEKFPWPKKSTDSVVYISAEQLIWLLDGYDIWKIKPFKKLSFERVI